MKRILPIAGLSLVLAAPAHAAPYQVYGCDGPDGRARGMQPFGSFEVPLDSMNHDDYCQAPLGVTYFEWPPGMTLGAGRRGGYRLDAPDGTTLSHFGWLGSAIGITGSGVRVEIASGDDGATLWEFAGDVPYDQRRYTLPAGTKTIILRQACRLIACSTGVLPARTTTTALTVSLDDASPPTASGFAGALTASGARHGTAGLTFDAADVGAGLRRATLEVDGATRASATLDGSASCTPVPGDPHGYDAVIPCARSAPVELAFATGSVADGTHTVSARVEDAAGNVRTVFGPAAIVTDNVAPIAGTVALTRSGQTLTATPAGFDGQDVAYTYRWQRCDPVCDDIDAATRSRYTLTSADAGTSVRAAVTATDLGGATTVRSAPLAIEPPPAATPTPSATPTATATPAPTVAVVAAPAPPAQPAAAWPAAPAPCPPGTTPAAAPTARAASPAPRASLARTAAPARATSALAAAVCLRVSLSRRTIKVAYGKRIEVRGRVTDSSGAPVAGATLDVSARVRTPGAKPRREGGLGTARDGRFTYVAPAGPSRDLTIGGTRVTLLVTAAGTFKATRTGARVRFSGRLKGGHIPRGGVLVEIRGGHRVVALTRTNGHGVFKTTTKATRLSFRAKARKDSSWPFVAAPVGSPVSV